VILSYSCKPKGQPEEVLDIELYSSYTGSQLKDIPFVMVNNISYDSLIQSVLIDIGFPNSDIQIRATNQFGAFAIISKNCRRRVFAYNQKFFDSVVNLTNSIRSVKSICFHEIAHHFYRHPLKSIWESKIHELEADRYSGFQMRLMGASIEETKAALEIFGNETATTTHPDKYTRINEIKAGYYDAGERYYKDKIEVVNDSLVIRQMLFNEQGRFEKISNDLKFYELAMSIPNIQIEPNNFNLPDIYKKLPLYGFLNKTILISENNEVIDIESNTSVGKYIIPFDDANYGLLQFETSSYRVENDEIYSITPSGSKILLGSKIN
tara:strand:+ start:932 stop:1900 length:969 start_codon:yes stop_codon:yes gene_type:complete